jgi:esterase/lipase
VKTIICLARPVISPNEFSGIPNELLILGAALKEKGYQSVVKDFDFLKEINIKWKNKKDWAKRAALEILNTNCQYVGITSMCSNYVLAIELAKEIKTLGNPILKLHLEP